MQKSVRYYHLIGTLILIILIQSCTSNQKPTDDRPKYIIPDSIMRIITIDSVQRTEKIDAITLTGLVDFNQDKQVNIFPMVSGIVQNIKVELGDYVKGGQELAVVKSSEMAGYSNNLIDAQSNLSVAKSNLEAQKGLFKNGFSSQLDLANAQSAYNQAEAQLQMVQRVLSINGNATNGTYTVKAPISGFVVQKNITNNTSIRTDNNSSMFVISDLANVWVQANVYESNISKVHLGDDAEVTTIAYPDKIFKGKIDKVMNVLDPTNKVMKVRVKLPNPGFLLKPEMFASVKIINKHPGSTILSVPSSAIIFDHSRHFVLLYHSPSNVQITPVELSGSNNNDVYISAGVKQGDRIISKDAILIYDALNN